MARRTPSLLLLRYQGLQTAAQERFGEEAAKRRWATSFAMPHRLVSSVIGNRIEVRVDGKPVAPDYVVFLSVGSHPKIVIPAMRQLTASGTRVLNDVGAAFRVRNRFNAMLLLAEAGLPTPSSALAAGNDEATEAAELVGYPLVVKRVEGSMAEGMGLVGKPDELDEGLDEVRHQVNEPVMLQHFIAESAGSDIRTIVIGDRVLGAMERRAIWPSEFRSSLRKGGLAKAVLLTDEEEQLVRRACAAAGLDYVAVDLLRTTRGPIILGLNAWPSFAEFESVTGANVAGAALDHLAAVAKRRKP